MLVAGPGGGLGDAGLGEFFERALRRGALGLLKDRHDGWNLADAVDLEVGEFVWTGGDCHLYLNHLEQVDEQLARVPLTLPKLAIARRPPTVFDYTFEDFQLVNYQHHPAIKAPVAV